jgi:predicted metal-dependent hydrolase
MSMRKRSAAGRLAGVNTLQMQLWPERDAGPGWHVRISRRARRLSMRVFPGGRVEVVVPPGVGAMAIERFVSRHREWAERRAREFELQAPLAAERRPERIELAAMGRAWSVEYLPGSRRSLREDDGGRLLVQGADASDAERSRVLIRWLTDVAGEHLGATLAQLSLETGIDYAKLQLRRQRTRWGSCSSAGTISLNLCLMFQPPEVVRYLVLHELCHRRHMNHSRRFWNLVGSFEPRWRELDAELLKGWRHVPAWVFP